MRRLYIALIALGFLLMLSSLLLPEQQDRIVILSGSVLSAVSIHRLIVLAQSVGSAKTIRELMASETRYRLLAKNLPDMSVLLFDNLLRIVLAEGQAFRRAQIDPRAIEGEQIAELLSGEAAGAYLPMYREALAGKASSIERRERNGRTYVVSALPLPGSLGDLGMSLILDITDRKRLEAQYLQAQKMESIGRLAGGVAHDFNNLLTAIIGNAELLQMTLTPETQSAADIEEVLRAARRATGLTRQLLAFSRQQIIEPRPISVNELVLDTSKLLRRLLGEHIELSVIPADSLAVIVADPGQIEQVIVNLAVNARDAMPQGGKLTIEIETLAIEESYPETGSLIEPGEYVRIAITDTGTGMSPETLAHAFEPFYTTKDVGKGTGLGLATSYGIVKQHGGSILIYSELGIGTVLKLYFPRSDAEAAPTRSDSILLDTRRLEGGSETILLVEDDRTVREFAERVLGELGYTILSATNGAEALDLAVRHAPAPLDLLLTDVVMPTMNGAQLAERFHALFPNVPILFVSGYTDNTVTHAGVPVAGIHFLQKPYERRQLARKVRSVLDSPALPYAPQTAAERA